MTGFRTGRLARRRIVFMMNEKDYNDQQLSIILNKPLAEIQKMKTAEKREILMKHRKEELRKLISVYYAAARLERHRHSESRYPQANRVVEFPE